jgi:spermidine synthase
MYILDKLGDGTSHLFSIEEILAYKRTKFQEVLICRLQDFGKSLFIGTQIQSTEADQEIYHNALTEPALKLMEYPLNILIIGSGEGVTAKKVLDRTTNSVTMVDIDREAVGLCKRYLSDFHCGAFSNEKLRLFFSDGFSFVKTTKTKYDVIFVDVTDPDSNEVAERMYSRTFYNNARKILDKEGLLVTQAGSTWFRKQNYLKAGKNLSNEFNTVITYDVFVPSYGSTWGFYVASPSKQRSDQIKQILKKLNYRLLNWECRLNETGHLLNEG